MSSHSLQNRFILLLFYLLLVSGLVLVYLNPKPGLFLALHSWQSPFGDVLMQILTFLGNGLAALIVIILLLFRRIRNGLFIFLSWAVSGIMAQLLKHLVFPDHLRPVKFLSDSGVDIRTVPGVEIHLYHGFPSGHTTTAFAVWFGLALMVRNIYLKIFFLLLATAVGFSRIYLAQHFPEDVLAGAALGGLSALIFLNLTAGWKRGWLDKPLLSLIRK